MAPIPTRIPPPEGLPSRDESRRELELTLARGRAKRELAEEKKLAEQNLRITPSPYSFDEFKIAAERLAYEDAIGAEIERQHEARMAAISKHFAAKRAHIRSMERARKILGDEKFFAALAEARRRRGK